MKTIYRKHIGLVLGLLVLAAALFIAAPSANAGEVKSLSFVNATSFNVTNTIGVTNLLSTVVTSNFVDTIYTNKAGTRVLVTATGGTNCYENLLRTVPLPSMRLAYALGNTTTNVPTRGTIFTRLVGGSGANSAVNFIFVPVFGDDPTGPASTVAGDAVTVAITATTTTQLKSATAFSPPITWYGAKWVRLKSVTNADTDAASQVTVLECSFNGEFD